MGGYVYAMGDLRGPSKFGSSIDPAHRQNEQRWLRGRPLGIYRYKYFDDDRYQLAERMLHYRLAKYKSRNPAYETSRDWFDLNIAEACFAFDLFVPRLDRSDPDEDGSFKSLWLQYPRPFRRRKPPEQTYTEHVREAVVAMSYLRVRHGLVDCNLPTDDIVAFIKNSGSIAPIRAVIARTAHLRDRSGAAFETPDDIDDIQVQLAIRDFSAAQRGVGADGLRHNEVEASINNPSSIASIRAAIFRAATFRIGEPEALLLGKKLAC